MRALLVAVFAVVGTLGVASTGCSSSSAGVACSPGQMLQCSCNGALTGTTTCDSTGHPLPCQCAPGSGSSSGGVSSSSGGSSSGTSSSGGSSGGVEEGGSGGGDATVDAPAGEGGALDGAIGG